MKPDWRPFMARDTRFRLRHGLTWLLYLWLLTLNLEMLLDAPSSSGLTLLAAVLLSWIAVFTAAANIEAWLDGANRWAAFRLALVLTAALSCVLAAWMVWHYAVFLMVGLVTMFQKPFELISLSLFGERLAAMLLSLVTFAAYAWLSLRVMRVLLSGELEADLDQVLGDRPPGSMPPALRDDAEPLPRVTPGFTPRERNSHLYPSAKAVFDYSFVGPPQPPQPPPPPETPGKQRYLCRPPELTPRFDGTYQVHGPPILQGLGFRHGIAPQKREKSAAIGWAGFEWVLRSEPSREEMVMALEALPNLASILDEDDAAEARAWISRLADHPGQYERALHPMEIIDHVTSETIRIAVVAMQTLFDWDKERGRIPAVAEGRDGAARTGSAQDS